MSAKSSKSPNRLAWLIAAVLVLGCILRFALLSRASVEHFDEGVYASNLLFDQSQGFRYPQRHLYAPPLVPSAIEWATVLTGSHSLSALLPSAFLGCLTLALVFYMARAWFGSAVAIAVTALAAFSDLHILYSRAALTDVWLTGFLAASIGVGWAAISRGRLRLALLAGLLAGGGWWCKYNGWLALLILGSGTLAWIVVERPGKSRVQQAIVAWLAITLTAMVVWSPVMIGLQSRGGYQAVAANHANYVVGFTGWLGSLKQQMANLRWLESPCSIASIPLALLLAATTSYRPFSSGQGQAKPNWLASSVLGAVAVAVAIRHGTAPVMGFLAVFGLVRGYLIFSEPNQRLAIWLLAAWFFGLLLATPLYHPYPRLTLPWIGCSWLAAGPLFLPAREKGTTSPSSGRSFLLLFLAAGLAAVGFLGPRSPDSVPSPIAPAWQSRTGLKEAAESIGEKLRSQRNAPQVVYVLGQPALFYQLRMNQIPAVPAAGLEMVNRLPDQVEAYLIAGPQAHQDPAFAERLAAHRDRLQRVAQVDYSPSNLVICNRYDIRKIKQRPVEHFDVYRIQPKR